MPALSLPLCILECDREDGFPLLDGVFSLGGVGFQGGVDGVEGGGGGECFYMKREEEEGSQWRGQEISNHMLKGN